MSLLSKVSREKGCTDSKDLRNCTQMKKWYQNKFKKSFNDADPDEKFEDVLDMYLKNKEETRNRISGNTTIRNKLNTMNRCLADGARQIHRQDEPLDLEEKDVQHLRPDLRSIIISMFVFLYVLLTGSNIIRDRYSLF